MSPRRAASKNPGVRQTRGFGTLLEELISDRIKAKEELQEPVIREEIKWWPKSRVN